VPAALLAATALDLGARMVTFDRGFRRFPGLTVVVPSGALLG
jgi:predicted nucleic acid-binding protein